MTSIKKEFVTPILVGLSILVIQSMANYFFFKQEPKLQHRPIAGFTFKEGNGKKNHYSGFIIENIGGSPASKLEIFIPEIVLKTNQYSIQSTVHFSKKKNDMGVIVEMSRFLAKDKTEIMFKAPHQSLLPNDLRITCDTGSSEIIKLQRESYAGYITLVNLFFVLVAMGTAAMTYKKMNHLKFG